MSDEIQFTTMGESVANLVQGLGEQDRLRVLAHITKREQGALAIAMAYNKWAKLDVLDELVNAYLLLSASVGGRARKQLTAIGTAAMGPPPSEDGGLFSRFKRWASGGSRE